METFSLNNRRAIPRPFLKFLDKRIMTFGLRRYDSLLPSRQSWLPEHLTETTVWVLPRGKLALLSFFNVPVFFKPQQHHSAISISPNLIVFRRFTCCSVWHAQNQPTLGVGRRRNQQNSTYQVLKVLISLLIEDPLNFALACHWVGSSVIAN